MVCIFHCPCVNFSLHLKREPQRINEGVVGQLPLSPDFTGNILEGQLTLGGIKVQEEKLFQTKEISSGWILHLCLNCNHEICVFFKESPQRVFLNGSLSQEIPNTSISPVYHLILEPNEEAVNNILDAPDKFDEEAYAAFTKLQTVLENSITEENRQMEHRIDEFIQQQQENFKKFQAQAYKDRKLLWSKMKSVNNWNTSQISNDSANSSKDVKHNQSVKSVGSIVTIIDNYESNDSMESMQVSSSIEKEKTSDVQPPVLNKTNVQENSATSEDKTVIFNFDEETTTQQNCEKYVQDDLEDVMNTGVNHEPERRVKVSDLFGTSLPVNIPKKFPEPKVRKTQLPPESFLSQQLLAEGNRAKEKDLEAKTFDRPMSRNKASSIGAQVP